MSKKKKKKGAPEYDLNAMQKVMGMNIREQTPEEFNKDNMAIFGANVNLKRHINEIRDGLKPVGRRLLMTLYDAKLFPNRDFAKCASIIGKVIDKYHPHGDTAAYEALVYMGQPWRHNVVLVDTATNFGSAYEPDGYSAYRYTNARMSAFAYDCFFSEWRPTNPETDVTVDWMPTYNEENLEPIYLPAKYPLFLLNWHRAMGVGRYTCTPGFNLAEAFKVVIELLKDPDAKVELYPECPKGSMLINKKDLKNFMDEPESRIKMRATYNIVHNKGRDIIEIENAPFEVSPKTVKEAIKVLFEKGQLPEISNIGGSSEDLGESFKISVEVKKGYDARAVMTKLYRKTQLEQTYSTRYAFVNDLCSVDHTPRIAILEWIRYRRETVKRIKKIRLLEILKRMHFVEPMIKVLESGQIEEFVRIVRSSKNKDVAIKDIMKLFDLTDYQAEKIVDVKLSSLSKDKLSDYKKELGQLKAESEEILYLLKKKKRIDALIVSQLEQGIEKYGTSRKTEITQLIDSVKIPDTEHYLIFTNKYVKKLPYFDGGYKIGRIDNGEKVLKILTVNNRKTIAIFTDDGRVLPIDVNEIGNASTQSVGISLSQLGCGGNFVDAMEISEDSDKNFVMAASSNGSMIKTDISELFVRKNKSYAFMKLGKSDNMSAVCLINDNDDILVYSALGRALLFPFSNFETTARNTKGVQAIKLSNDDTILGLASISKDDTYLVTVTDRGYMKRFPIKNMPKTKRNEQGIEINNGNGILVKAKSIEESSESMIAYTTDGAFQFDPMLIKANNRIGKNERVIEISSMSSYVFDMN